MKKVTLKVIAAKSGVGTATVERVLNGRGGVRPQTAEKVIAAVRKLDYPKRLPELHRGVTRIEIILLRPELTFTARLARSFERIAANLDRSIAVHRTIMAEDDPQAIAEQLMSPKLRRSALIVGLPHHPVTSAAIQKLKLEGLPIVQLFTRMEGLEAPFVGIDNAAAGRMAGLLMSGLQRRRGPVVVLCHSQIYAVHRDRVTGFSDYMTRAPSKHLDFTYAGFTYDKADELARVTEQLLASTPDLAGIYAAGGDYGPLCDVLRRHDPARRICLIGHELTEQSRLALKDGTIAAVIDQAPETQARRAIDTALHALGLLESQADASPIRFVTLTAENV